MMIKDETYLYGIKGTKFDQLELELDTVIMSITSKSAVQMIHGQ